MTLTVRFAGTSPVLTTGVDEALRVWSYTVEAATEGDLAIGEVIALGLPVSITVHDPALFPDDPGLAEYFKHDNASSRQYSVLNVSAPGVQTISFVAHAAASTAELLLFTMAPGGRWDTASFVTDTHDSPAVGQVLPAPAPALVPASQPGATVQPAAHDGRPAADFKGTLPYASEIFGVYQPLAGWLGHRNTRRITPRLVDPSSLGSDRDVFTGPAARTLDNPELAQLTAHFQPRSQGVLSPIGLVTLYREYFFQFDTFLGTPVGHIWISPGGTVEVVESSTRRMVIEKTAAQSEDVTRKAEETLTQQDDVADAIKEENANDTKLGASASAGANFAGIYHGDASASFSSNNTTKKSSEVTHKHTRTQSAKVSSEIHRNFKTTFKTVTESTDTTSRRYVVQNTTKDLVNYELRRKMRKVGVQVQHIGTRLSWQVFLDNPGSNLGLGDLVHVVEAPDLSAIKKPEPPPPPPPKVTTFVAPFPIRKFPGTDHDPHINMNFGIHSPNSDDILDYPQEFHLVAKADYGTNPPMPGYTLSSVSLVSAKSGGADRGFMPQHPINVSDDGKTGKPASFTIFADFLNTGDLSPIILEFALNWNPPVTDPAKAQYDHELIDYNAKVAELQRSAYATAIRERLKLVSSMRPRPTEDLRTEERQSVYGNLIRQLELFSDSHLGSELIRQIFDVDEMLYFAASDYWRPSDNVPKLDKQSVGKYPVPAAPTATPAAQAPDQLAGQTVASWYSYTDQDNSLTPDRVAKPEWRVNYLVTESTQPAPLASSLGWLIQADGDERRNEFLNAAWVKAVLPIRPGHERDALAWLAQVPVEGEAGLGQPYPFQPGDPPAYEDKTIGEVLELLATELEASNTDMANTLATEKVFETGFDPLAGGFRPAQPYQVFDQWLEVLPTDQIVAVAVNYDPKTGQQL